MPDPPEPRAAALERLRGAPLDALIVGGGINGAVSASALAARGLAVGLVERGDFAGRTSQASSNLAWGGMKYLESGEFRLVYDLCRSRNRLMRAYPDAVREVRILTLVERGFRWHPLLMFVGALFYWLLGAAFTRAPRYVSRRRLAREEPLMNPARAWGALEHSESLFVDTDARFVYRFVGDARAAGAACVNYVEAIGAEHGIDGWTVTLRDTVTGETWTTRARVLINACGPGADRFNAAAGVETRWRHVLSKGAHLIVPRLSPRFRVLSFFTDDGRLFFVLPLAGRTMIGTTDTAAEDDDVAVDPPDRAYLLGNVTKRITAPLAESAVIAERAGVRPLALEAGEQVGEIDWLKLSRRHAVEVQRDRAYVAIYGGKLTDCLNIGEEIGAALAELGLPGRDPAGPWFGEPPASARARFMASAEALGLTGDDDGTGHSTAERLWRRHGRGADAILDAIRADGSAAERVITEPPYTRAEIEYMARDEQIVRLDDFLRRRTELALVYARGTLASHPGVWDACRIVFGEEAEAQWRATFEQPPPG